MAATELEEEDQVQATALSEQSRQEQMEKKQNEVGRRIQPIYLRKGDLARFAETKKRSAAHLLEKNNQDIQTTRKNAAQYASDIYSRG
jgi:hypothetical protein